VLETRFVSLERVWGNVDRRYALGICVRLSIFLSRWDSGRRSLKGASHQVSHHCIKVKTAMVRVNVQNLARAFAGKR